MTANAVTVRQRLPADLRKRQIVETALDLVAAHGADAVTTHAIADAIGVSQAAIFRHFSTKEAIWVAVLDWLDDRLATIHRRAEGEADAHPVEALERMFLAHVDLVERYPAFAKLVFSDHLRLRYPSLNERFAPIHEAYRLRVAELIARAKSEGAAAADLAPAQAATLYLCMAQGLMFQIAIARLPIAPQPEAKRLFALYRRAIAAK